MNIKDNSILSMKGPSIIRPSKKYRYKIRIKTGENAYYLTKLSIPRPLNINYPMAPLDWDDKDQGVTSDKNWRLHYYKLGNIDRRNEVKIEVEFISNPRCKLRLFILLVTFAGYTDPKFKNWAEIAEEKKIILYLPRLDLFSFKKPLKKPTLNPNEFVPTYSEAKSIGWELMDSSLPPLKEIDGYDRGIMISYGSVTKNRMKTIIVGVYKFDDKKYADKYFDRQCDMWLEMHRSSSETIRIHEVMNTKGIIWKAKNGVIYNWPKENYIFSIHGITADIRDVEDFIKIIYKKM